METGAMDTGLVSNIARLADEAATIPGVRSGDVRPGDWIIVRTKNSTYSLSALHDGRFMVSGGWFAAAFAEDRPVRIRGCTWGGRAILEGMIAAPGMCIEFDNGVCTTRAREVRVLRGGAPHVH
jgi:hypothetical protein